MKLALINQKNINLSKETLFKKIVERKEGIITKSGAIAANTGLYTGRSPKDKFIVLDESTKNRIHWGTVNKPVSKEVFYILYDKICKHLQEKEVFVFKGFAGADKSYQLPIQVVTEFAWHNLFAQHLFVRPTEEELKNHKEPFTVISAPTFKADPRVDGTNSEVFIIINFEEKMVLIGGTEYAGEIKKSVFSIMNYLLPKQNTLPMHCSANVGELGDVALFFGLSGTGKTTLSADPKRSLIGDDEHGWSPKGVFNFEGGCYAKTVGLKRENEPEIFDAIRDGAILENVVIDENGNPSYEDTSLTENTRAAYPIHHLKKIRIPSVSGNPQTIIFLTADAFGVLPPISKLNQKQAIYYFLNGYTSKLAGTERGITEPRATFSACFGEPFLPLDPKVYANMLKEKIQTYQTQVYLVNTGWIGGSYGEGERIKLPYTRAMIHSALNGELKKSEFVQEDHFGLMIPTHISNVPNEILNPKNTWKNKDQYDQKASHLKKLFEENYLKF